MLHRSRRVEEAAPEAASSRFIRGEKWERSGPDAEVTGMEDYKDDEGLLSKNHLAQDPESDEDSLFIRETYTAPSTAWDSDQMAGYRRSRFSQFRGGQQNKNRTPSLQQNTSSYSDTGEAETSRSDDKPPSTTNRAHEMKSALANVAVTAPTAHKRRLPVEHDPENHTIKRMRVEERKSWGDIAKHLNTERIKDGKVH